MSRQVALPGFGHFKMSGQARSPLSFAGSGQARSPLSFAGSGQARSRLKICRKRAGPQPAAIFRSDYVKAVSCKLSSRSRSRAVAS